MVLDTQNDNVTYLKRLNASSRWHGEFGAKFRQISWGFLFTVRCNKGATCRPRLKYDGTRAETRFPLSGKRTSPFKSAGASVQSTTGSRGVRVSCSNAGYTLFRGSVKSTGYPLQSPVSPSLPLPCVTVCHHISTGLYLVVNSLRSLYTPLSPASCAMGIGSLPEVRRPRRGVDHPHPS